LLKGEFDVIQDFDPSMDKIKIQAWCQLDSQKWLDQIFSLGKITDTQDGVILKFDPFMGIGELLLVGVKYNQLNSNSIEFC